MQQNFTYPTQPYFPQVMNPNAVNINIISPQAYSSNPNQMTAQYPAGGFYPMYGPNQMPSMPLYPQNYNNMIAPYNMNALPNNAQFQNPQDKNIEENKKEEKTQEDKKDEKDKAKTITPLNDEYIKSLENYLDNDNPKIRLIGIKELLERFKEEPARKDNPSLIPLLNKALRDTSAAVRFLALTTLQLGYSVGNDETVQILKEIQTSTQDKTGEDALLASEILLRLASPEPVEVKEDNKQ